MSQNQKIENDYNDYGLKIEQEAKDRLRRINEKIDQIKKEATKVGKSIETETPKKKLK